MSRGHTSLLRLVEDEQGWRVVTLEEDEVAHVLELQVAQGDGV